MNKIGACFKSFFSSDGFIIGSAIAVLFATTIGGTAYLETIIKSAEPDEPRQEMIQELAHDIVNPAISPLSLQERGYFSNGNGSKFLDVCRESALSKDFGTASEYVVAQVITECAINNASTEHKKTIEAARLI